MKIKFVKELPQWIISSNKAAYHPHSFTIWISTNRSYYEIVKCLIHELGHHLIEITTNSKTIHLLYDKSK